MKERIGKKNIKNELKNLLSERAAQLNSAKDSSFASSKSRTSSKSSVTTSTVSKCNCSGSSKKSVSECSGKSSDKYVNKDACESPVTTVCGANLVQKSYKWRALIIILLFIYKINVSDLHVFMFFALIQEQVANREFTVENPINLSKISLEN